MLKIRSIFCWLVSLSLHLLNVNQQPFFGSWSNNEGRLDKVRVVRSESRGKRQNSPKNSYTCCTFGCNCSKCVQVCIQFVPSWCHWSCWRSPFPFTSELAELAYRTILAAPWADIDSVRRQDIDNSVSKVWTDLKIYYPPNQTCKISPSGDRQSMCEFRLFANTVVYPSVAALEL